MEFGSIQHELKIPNKAYRHLASLKTFASFHYKSTDLSREFFKIIDSVLNHMRKKCKTV